MFNLFMSTSIPYEFFILIFRLFRHERFTDIESSPQSRLCSGCRRHSRRLLYFQYLRRFSEERQDNTSSYDNTEIQKILHRRLQFPQSLGQRQLWKSKITMIIHSMFMHRVDKRKKKIFVIQIEKILCERFCFSEKRIFIRYL